MVSGCLGFRISINIDDLLPQGNHWTRTKGEVNEPVKKNRGDFCGPKKIVVRILRVPPKNSQKTCRNSYIPGICLKQKHDLPTHLSFSRCIQLMEGWKLDPSPKSERNASIFQAQGLDVWINLAKLTYFTNLGFPEIREFPLLNHHLGAQVVWGRYNLTRSFSYGVMNLMSFFFGPWKFSGWWFFWTNPSEKYARQNGFIFP